MKFDVTVSLKDNTPIVKFTRSKVSEILSSIRPMLADDDETQIIIKKRKEVKQ